MELFINKGRPEFVNMIADDAQRLAASGIYGGNIGGKYYYYGEEEMLQFRNRLFFVQKIII